MVATQHLYKKWSNARTAAFLAAAPAHYSLVLQPTKNYISPPSHVAAPAAAARLLLLLLPPRP